MQNIDYLERFKNTENKTFLKIQGSENTLIWEKIGEKQYQLTAIHPGTNKERKMSKICNGEQMVLLTAFLIAHQRVFWSF